MGSLWTSLFTSFVTLGAVWFAYWLAGKPRLIVFSPNSTLFQLDPPQAGSPPMSIRAGQVFLQNSGRKSATEIQIVAEQGPHPWGYNIVPPVDHTTRTGSRGEWVLELGFLGPGETVVVQVLNGPQIASVRAKEGPAKAVPVAHQRLYPKWFNRLAVFLMLMGLITLAYAVVILLLWASKLT
jgi:hypothetical protein